MTLHSVVPSLSSSPCSRRHGHPTGQKENFGTPGSTLQTYPTRFASASSSSRVR